MVDTRKWYHNLTKWQKNHEEIAYACSIFYILCANTWQTCAKIGKVHTSINISIIKADHFSGTDKF